MNYKRDLSRREATILMLAAIQSLGILLTPDIRMGDYFVATLKGILNKAMEDND